MRLRLEDSICGEILRVDVWVRSQEGVELGVCIRPGKNWTRAPGSMTSLSAKYAPAWQPLDVTSTGGMLVLQSFMTVRGT